MNVRTHTLALVLLAWSIGATPMTALAIAFVETQVQLEDVNGKVAERAGLLAADGPVGQGGVSLEAGGAVAAGFTSYEIEPIRRYAKRVIEDPDSPLQFIDGIRWWTKLSADLAIDHQTLFATQVTWATRRRGSEDFAVLAFAPNSASGFATDAPPSALGGPGIRVNVFARFEGGIYDGFGSHPDTPEFFFGSGFIDSFGEPPEPDFNAAIADINQGASLVVDLDAAGVAVGDEYTFVQRYKLGVGPSVDLLPGQLAFVNLDPIIGFFSVPAPGAFALAGLGLLLVAGAGVRVRSGR